MRVKGKSVVLLILTFMILCMAIFIYIIPVEAETTTLTDNTVNAGDKAQISESNDGTEKTVGIDEEVKPSPENGKPGLKALKKKIAKELKGKKGKWSVYIQNLDTNEYMLINNKKLPSASLIKLFVMLTVYDEIDKGNLKETSKVKTGLKNMITISDNASANELTSLLSHKKRFSDGIKYINKYCRKNGYSKTGFFVEMGKCSLKNVTSVKDCGWALERMYRKTAVGKKSSGKMLKLLKAQERRTKIPAGIPANVTVANKTGETYFAENDAAIVFSEGADYVIVVMSKNGNDAASEIRKISKITYRYFN